MTTKHQNWCRLCGTRFVANSRMELEEQFFLHSASSEETDEDSFCTRHQVPWVESLGDTSFEARPDPSLIWPRKE